MPLDRKIFISASDLVISLGTVKAHANHIYGKTHASGRQELIKMFWSE